MDKKDEKGNIYVDAQLEIAALNKKITDLEVVVSRLKEVVIDNDLQDEIPEIDCISLEEKICINAVRHISQLVEAQDYDKNDIGNFQVVFNIIRAVRGKEPSGNKRFKNIDVTKALKALDGGIK